MGVEETLCVVGEHPFRHDRAAAGHDAGDALCGEVDIGEAHARMDGDIVDALLALFDQRVAVDLPGEVLGDAVHFFEGLIDGDRADGHWRVADDPFARVMDVAAGRQVHDIVGAPAGRPDHLVDFFLDR